MKKDTHDKLSRRMAMNMISTGPLVWIDLYWFGLILYGLVKKSEARRACGWEQWAKMIYLYLSLYILVSFGMVCFCLSVGLV